MKIGVRGNPFEHITHFLLGLAKHVDVNNPMNSVFVPFCKVGTGYSMSELTELRSKLRDQWMHYDPKFRPKYFACKLFWFFFDFLIE